mgnify:CR=1 FL=1|tara:strand:- start:497 stop:910 length:414 start_codon:yes stop_codon:yes gene_type:complete
MLSKTAFNRMKKAELVEWALETQRTAGEAALFAEEDVEEPDRTEAEDRYRAFLSELETRLNDKLKTENDQLKEELEKHRGEQALNDALRDFCIDDDNADAEVEAFDKLMEDECMTPSLAFVTMKDQFRRPGGKIWGW